jgi:uncharacterized protein
VTAAGVRRSPALAAGWGAPIGLLGGLLGLGGAEFRLPILVQVFGYRAPRAVALNLAISLITVASALAVRSGTLALAPLGDLASVMAAIAGGAMVAAWVGVGFVHRVSERTLERVIVASALGVAGGELIIPTLVFAFGADIVTAGTASLAISLPIVAVGVARHARHDAFVVRADLSRTVAPDGGARIGQGEASGRVVQASLIPVVNEEGPQSTFSSSRPPLRRGWSNARVSMGLLVGRIWRNWTLPSRAQVHRGSSRPRG